MNALVSTSFRGGGTLQVLGWGSEMYLGAGY